MMKMMRISCTIIGRLQNPIARVGSCRICAAQLCDCLMVWADIQPWVMEVTTGR